MQLSTHGSRSHGLAPLRAHAARAAHAWPASCALHSSCTALERARTHSRDATARRHVHVHGPLHAARLCSSARTAHGPMAWHYSELVLHVLHTPGQPPARCTRAAQHSCAHAPTAAMPLLGAMCTCTGRCTPRACAAQHARLTIPWPGTTRSSCCTCCTRLASLLRAALELHSRTQPTAAMPRLGAMCKCTGRCTPRACAAQQARLTIPWPGTTRSSCCTCCTCCTRLASLLRAALELHSTSGRARIHSRDAR